MMWSFGHFTLGLPSDWLERYTFAEYYLLYDRWKESQYSDDYRASVVAVAVASQYAKDLQLDHFVRPQFRPPEQHEEQMMPQLNSTPEEIIACVGPDFYSPAGGLL